MDNKFFNAQKDKYKDAKGKEVNPGKTMTSNFSASTHGGAPD